MIQFQSFLSGSSGNCTFVTNGNTHLLVDCGAGGKYITECMRRVGVAPEELSGILITHEHRDHIMGAGIVSRRFNLPIYATKKTWDAMEDVIGEIAPGNRRLTAPEMTFKDFTVRSFAIPHDAAQPVGYSFLCDGEKFTVATDMGHITDEVMEAISGSNSIIIEANHDVHMLETGRYPYPLKKRILGDKGHLSNAACGKLCVELIASGTSAIWLGHLSAENNNPTTAFDTVSAAISTCKCGGSVSLNVLPRYWIQ